MEALGARVYKYRDAKNREANAVLQFNDGTWALTEVKLGSEADIKKARTTSSGLLLILIRKEREGQLF